MKFTAHDLKRLKEGNHFIECTHLGKRCGIKLEALLARLEAAETVIRAYGGKYRHELPELRAWRESKGE